MKWNPYYFKVQQNQLFVKHCVSSRVNGRKISSWVPQKAQRLRGKPNVWVYHLVEVVLNSVFLFFLLAHHLSGHNHVPRLLGQAIIAAFWEKKCRAYKRTINDSVPLCSGPFFECLFLALGCHRYLLSIEHTPTLIRTHTDTAQRLKTHPLPTQTWHGWPWWQPLASHPPTSPPCHSAALGYCCIMGMLQ